MQNFLRLYGRIVGGIGLAVLLALLVRDLRDWTDVYPFILLLAGTAATRTSRSR